MATRRSKDIPPEVVDKLLADLAPFSAALSQEAHREVHPSRRTVKIVTTDAKAFTKPRASKKKFDTLQIDTEFPLIGQFGDFVGIEHRNQAHWVSSEHVKIAANVGPGSQDTIHHEDLAPTTKGSALSEIWGSLKASLLRRAIALRDEYRENPYITIKGFTIELGLVPSLSIEFEFKDPS
jgi:hypothetical protein